MTDSPPSPGPDLFFAGGECLSRFGVLVRRTDAGLEDTTREVEVRDSAVARAIGSDGILRIHEADRARVEYLTEGDLDKRNILAESNFFSGLAWINARSLESTSAIENPFDPDSNSTKLIADNTAANTHYIFQIVPKQAGAEDFVFSIYVRAQQFDQCELLLSNGTIGDRIEATYFFGVGSEPTASVVTANATWIPGTATVEKVDVDWVRLTISGTSDIGLEVRVNCFLHDGTSSTFDGDGFSGFNIFGAQLERGLDATAYQAQPTDPDRKIPSLLLEAVATNFLTASEDLPDAAWQKVDVTVFGNISAITAPDGTNNADNVTEGAGVAAEHDVRRDLSTSINTAVCVSGFFRASGANRQWIAIRILDKDGNGPRTWFDVLNGTIGEQNTDRATIEDYGNGWFRCSCTTDNIGNGGSQTSVFFGIAESNGVAVYNGNSTGTITMWGLTHEASQTTPTSYISTTPSTSTLRNPDQLHGIFPHPPQRLTAYVKFQEYGSARTFTTTRIFQIGDKIGNTPQLYVQNSGANTYGIVHQNGSQGIGINNPISPNFLDFVELRAIVYEDGAVEIFQMLNRDGVESTSGRSAGIDPPFGDRFSAEEIQINSLGNQVPGFLRLLALKIHRGTQDLAFMRRL